MMAPRFDRPLPESLHQDHPVRASHSFPTGNGTAVHVPLRSRRRHRVTVFLPAPLLERLRNAVYWTAHRPLAQIIADAVEEAVAKLEQANGGAFPTRLSPLKVGRPSRARLSSPPSPPRPTMRERP
jgi:hypothetical protein